MRPVNPDQRDLHQYVRDPATAPGFASNPLAIALGAQILRVDVSAGLVELAFEPKELFVQGAGVLQGGAVAAMLDFSMAYAVLAVLPISDTCSTANLNVAFLRAAPKGRYIAIGEIERKGRALAFTRARLFKEGAPEAVVATGSSTLALKLTS